MIYDCNLTPELEEYKGDEEKQKQNRTEKQKSNRNTMNVMSRIPTYNVLYK